MTYKNAKEETLPLRGKAGGRRRKNSVSEQPSKRDWKIHLHPHEPKKSSQPLDSRDHCEERTARTWALTSTEQPFLHQLHLAKYLRPPLLQFSPTHTHEKALWRLYSVYLPFQHRSIGQCQASSLLTVLSGLAGKNLRVGKLWTLTVSTSFAVESILAITIFSWSLYVSPSLSHMGASCLQWPHQGASEKQFKTPV